MTDEKFDNLTVDRICILIGKNGGNVTQAIQQHSVDTGIPADKLEKLYAEKMRLNSN